MVRVPLDVFVDYILARTASKVEIARRFKSHPHAPVGGAYSKLRQAMREAQEAQGDDPAALDARVTRIVDAEAARLFTPMVEGYRKFLSLSPMVPIPAPRARFAVGDLEMETTVDVAFKLSGAPTLIKLAFVQSDLRKERADLTLALMWTALTPAHPSATLALLDVKNGQLHVMKPARYKHLAVLCRAEAAHFATVYSAL